MNRKYCQHCNEWIMEVSGNWVGVKAHNDEYKMWGNPATCANNDFGHLPR